MILKITLSIFILSITAFASDTQYLLEGQVDQPSCLTKLVTTRNFLRFTGVVMHSAAAGCAAIASS